MKSKTFTLLFFSFIIFKTVVAQNHTIEIESPITFEASFVGDVVNNLSGGIKKGTYYLGMANLKISFETEKANLWKGGQMFLNAANTHGKTPTADLVGDFQTFSNLEAGNLNYIQELWYKQSFGKASFIVGLQDLVVEFLSSEHAAMFLNSSFGVHSTISDNLPVPIFPLTSLGAQFHFNFSEKWVVKTAIFDGVPDDFDVNPYNVSWKLKKNDGYLAFSEIAFQNTTENFLGTYKIGAYYHNPHIIETENGDDILMEEHNENSGFYATIDQTVFNNSAGKQLSIFTLASISPKSENENWYYLGFGANYIGLFPNRTSDILGLAVAHAGFKEKNNETAVELSYKIQISENFSFQPDFQYIINPAGTDLNLDNAFVANIRLGINF